MPARIIRTPEDGPGPKIPLKPFLVEFHGFFGWRRDPIHAFATYEGAASWIAAQGLELADDPVAKLPATKHR